MNEIQTIGDVGLTLYAQVKDFRGYFFNTATAEFEEYASANWTTYAVPMKEQGQSDNYYGDFPSAITAAGFFSIVVYHRAGANPAESDTAVAAGSVQWDGVGAIGGSGLISLAYAKQFLGISGTASDAALTAYVAAASAMARDFCRRDFTVTSYSEVYDIPQRHPSLVLRNIPVLSIGSVTLDPYANGAKSINGDQFSVSRCGEVLAKPSASGCIGFPVGLQSVQVAYQAGYAVVPASVQIATALMVQRLFSMAGKDTTFDSETLGDYSYRRNGKAFEVLSDDVKATLSPYRVFSV